MQLRQNASAAPAAALTRWNTLAQVTAHVQWAYARAAAIANPATAHTTGGQVGEAPACVRGFHASNATVVAAVLTNGCDTVQAVTLPAGHASVWTYLHDMGSGDTYAALADCAASRDLWRCGPATPLTASLPTNGTVVLPPLSIVVVAQES